MTNKKIDIWLRFILYTIPLIAVFIVLWNYLKNDHLTTINFNEVRSIFNNINDWLRFTKSSNSIFKPFYDWFMTNIIRDSSPDTFFIVFVIQYCFYLLYVEISILFKNILLFIIRVANQMIERGSEIGK